MHLSALLEKAQKARCNLTRAELLALLKLEGEEELTLLYRGAYEVKTRQVGKYVGLRGLVEMGNICAKNCRYCGIRRGNTKLERFQLDADAVVRMAEWAYGEKYGSVVLQSGEIESDEHTELIAGIVRRIAAFSSGEMGVTLCLGEQSSDVYRHWRDAGAHRYLLRIETSSPDLYRRLHPADHSFARRKKCLQILRELDYQVGTGVMSGLPGQTAEHLADDIIFFRDMDVDMIGMGPFIPHPDTPLGKNLGTPPEYLSGQLRTGLKMIAVARLYLHNVNIASTTALQALAADGRERGLLAGANVIMPNITDAQYRRQYQLYAGKPCLEENADHCRGCIARRIIGIGEDILWGKRADSPHYLRRDSMPQIG
ncbi:MAG: [FeFe] hydrogenase H-cluster radical SAM maturase HydE [Planctomycetes bacterium]|nr:[FeFe] hydrogenase H-cluster radical SAM maturase HydE [Planctomycetota bacterium]